MPRAPRARSPQTAKPGQRVRTPRGYCLACPGGSNQSKSKLARIRSRGGWRAQASEASFLPTEPGPTRTIPRSSPPGTVSPRAGFTGPDLQLCLQRGGPEWPRCQRRLLRVHRAARERLVERGSASQTLAGRSMGGRMGTYLAADGMPVDSAGPLWISAASAGAAGQAPGRSSPGDYCPDALLSG